MTPAPTPTAEEIERLTDDDLDAIGLAIEAARCPGREGPYGGYDYGYNTSFYGPAPAAGRYVVRDFRDPSSDLWGAWAHQTHDEAEHEATYARLTRQHIARMAVLAVRDRIMGGER